MWGLLALMWQAFDWVQVSQQQSCNTRLRCVFFIKRALTVVYQSPWVDASATLLCNEQPNQSLLTQNLYAVLSADVLLTSRLFLAVGRIVSGGLR